MNFELKKILSEIDLTKSVNSNFPYMKRHAVNSRLNVQNEEELPLSVSESKWEIDTGMMSRVYHVENRDHFSYFLNNILDHAKEVNHDPMLIINYPRVSIKLKTHDLDEVTELDLEFAKFIDEIFQDIKFISEEF